MHKLTKEELKFITDNWEKMNKEEIAQKLNVSMHVLMSWTGILRKLGVPLLRKNNYGNRDIIREFAEEWILKHERKQKKVH